MKKHSISLAAVFFLFTGSVFYAQLHKPIPKLVDISLERISAVKIGENSGGTQVRITFTVKNNSAVSTSVGAKSLARYFEVMLTRKWSPVEPPAFLGMFKIAHLGPWESQIVKHEEWIVKEIHNCTYTAKADSNNWIQETNEGNNEKSFSFNI
jgi:hypothetical protein